MSKTKFRQKSMREEMRKADKGRDTVYPTYKFGGGKHSELYKDRVGGIGPRFAGRS